jgi:hypothetical protein
MAAPILNNNPQQYSKVGNDWIISAGGGAKPLVIPSAPPLVPTPLPLLEVDGIIVSIDGVLICSPQTLSDVMEAEVSGNFHYSPLKVGPVEGKMMGGGIPILSINTTALALKGEERDLKNRNAGVDSVDYLYEGELVNGIPKSLLNQINYFLNENKDTPPADVFTLWNWKFAGDYSVDVLVTATKQKDNFLDRAKLTEFLGGVSQRLRLLREDFNAIKYVFFNATTPPNNGYTTVSRVASAEEDSTHTVLFKSYDTIAIQPNTGSMVPQSVPIEQQPIV